MVYISLADYLLDTWQYNIMEITATPMQVVIIEHSHVTVVSKHVVASEHSLQAYIGWLNALAFPLAYITYVTFFIFHLGVIVIIVTNSVG